MVTPYTELLTKYQMSEKAWLAHHNSCEKCTEEGSPKGGASIFCPVGQELADVMDHYGLELQDAPEFVKNT